MSRKVTVGVSFGSSEMELIEAVCARSGRNKSQVVRFIVKRYFEMMQDGLILVRNSFPELDLLDVLKMEVPDGRY